MTYKYQTGITLTEQTKAILDWHRNKSWNGIPIAWDDYLLSLLQKATEYEEKKQEENDSDI